MTLRASRSCDTCDGRVRRLRQVRLAGRTFCGHRCAADARDAAAKARHDKADSNPLVCRCAGAPNPLEPIGPHCRECRRMFSVGVRLWLVRRDRRRRLLGVTAVTRWFDELAAQLRLQRIAE